MTNPLERPEEIAAPSLDPELAHLAEFRVEFGSGGVDLLRFRAAMEPLAATPPSRTGAIGDRFTIREAPPLSIDTFAPTTRRPHPCLVWFHGGGFVVGSPAMDAERLQGWTVDLDCVTVSVDYRLAPEHPFPAAHDDAIDALSWILQSSDYLGIDAERVVIGGASAGAGLAAALGLAARDRGVRLGGMLLFYPMLDDRQETVSSRWRSSVWPPEANEFGWRAYLGDLYGGSVPAYAAPARATDLGGVAPTLLIVGEADGFVDEDLGFAAGLTRAGVPTELRVVAGAPHGFDMIAPDAGASRAAIQVAERWLRLQFGNPDDRPDNG